MGHVPGSARPSRRDPGRDSLLGSRGLKAPSFDGCTAECGTEIEEVVSVELDRRELSILGSWSPSPNLAPAKQGVGLNGRFGRRLITFGYAAAAKAPPVG